MGLPLGPNAVKNFMDSVVQPDIFLWRPTTCNTYLEEAMMSFVAWPVNKVVFEQASEVKGKKSDQAEGLKSITIGSESPPQYSLTIGSQSKVDKSPPEKPEAKVAKQPFTKSPATSTKSTTKRTHAPGQSPIRRS